MQIHQPDRGTSMTLKDDMTSVSNSS